MSVRSRGTWEAPAGRIAVKHRLELAAKALAIERMAKGGLAAIAPARTIQTHREVPAARHQKEGKQVRFANRPALHVRSAAEAGVARGAIRGV